MMIDSCHKHSDAFLKMALRKDRCKIMLNHDGHAKSTGQCGDSIEIFIKVARQNIQHITYNINGCENTYACANTLVTLAEGRDINKAWEISPEDIIRFLETLPSGEHHCAELVVGAFYKALSNFQERKNLNKLP